MNVADRLTEHARNQPDHPAIEDGERIVRYGELDGLVNDACANLQGLGIEAGDMVLVMLPDSADHLIIICALLRAGAVILSLSDRLPPGARAKYQDASGQGDDRFFRAFPAGWGAFAGPEQYLLQSGGAVQRA